MPTVRELRASRNWSRRELGEAVGVSGQAVYTWESGRKFPSLRTLRALSQAFGVPIEEITFPGEEAASPGKNEEDGRLRGANGHPDSPPSGSGRSPDDGDAAVSGVPPTAAPPSATRPTERTPRAHPLQASVRVTAGARAKLSVGETWQDWWPDAPDPDSPSPDLITKDELLARLRAEGVEVTAFDLANWQRARVIPYGIKRWRGDGTYALYPAEFMVALVQELRSAQAQGWKLDEIAGWLRYQVAPSLATRPPGSATVWAEIARGVAVPDDLRQRLVAWAHAVARRHGTPIVRARVELIDDHGRLLTGIVDTLLDELHA